MNHAWNDNKRPQYISGGSSLLSFPKWPFKCFILKWSQLCKKVRLEYCLRRFENLNMDEFHEYIWCAVHSCVLSSIQVIESSLHIENQRNVHLYLYAAIKTSFNNEIIRYFVIMISMHQNVNWFAMRNMIIDFYIPNGIFRLPIEYNGKRELWFNVQLSSLSSY